MKRYFAIFKTLFRFSIITNMAYPTDFIIWALIDSLWAAINIGFFRILLFNIPNISGWSFDQLTIPLGIFSLVNAFIWGLFYGNMKDLASSINKGNLDMVLTKPVSSQFLVSIRNISISLFPSVLIGIFLLYHGFIRNNLPIIYILFIPLILISSVIIFYSIYFISTCFAFWANRLNNIAELATHLSDLGRYPLEIYPQVVRFVLTFIIPFGMLAIHPSKVLLSLINPFSIFTPLIISLVLLILSTKMWNYSLKHYSSASS